MLLSASLGRGVGAPPDGTLPADVDVAGALSDVDFAGALSDVAVNGAVSDVGVPVVLAGRGAGRGPGVLVTRLVVGGVGAPD